MNPQHKTHGTYKADIIKMLVLHREMTTAQIALRMGTTEPAISRHLKRLTTSGDLRFTAQSGKHFFSIAKQVLVEDAITDNPFLWRTYVQPFQPIGEPA